MKSTISRSLDGLIARSTFNALKHGTTNALKDCVVVEMLSSSHTLAFQALSSKMESWQVYQLRLRLENDIAAANVTPNKDVDPELYFREFVEKLVVYNTDTHRITTLHALCFIVSDAQTAIAKNLQLYGLDAQALSMELLQYSVTTDLLHGGLDPMLQRKVDAPYIDSQITNGVGIIEVKGVDSPAIAAPHPLDKFGVDMTRLAADGKIDPVVGRVEETHRLIEILSRRKKNNPILVGEAGVGKSAVVEGLALRIAEGDVPQSIRDKRLYSIDISALVAGTKFRGEFEERMQELLEALRKSNDSIIFFDEIHTIVGAGSTQGSLDTANILKPALARGELQVIGATTLNEYRSDIESDSALERRFQKIVVEPTTDKQTLEILRRIAPQYAEHHGVEYADEALRACVALSSRYITDRHQPDKAIDILDEVGARLHMRGDAKEVDVAAVEAVITSMTGIPVERLSQGEMERLRHLESDLGRKIIGQPQAVSSIAQTIRRARAGLKDAASPIGVFLFVGPTGVGKTLLAKEVSQWMFEHNSGLVRLDMSEYNQKHTVARLIGSPPGYVGYGEGGELTEAVRRQPYSVILLDEIEKAHPEVLNVMLQLFDEGHLTDGSGRRVDFRNTIIIMTSNTGAMAAAASQRQRMGYDMSSSAAKVATNPAKATNLRSWHGQHSKSEQERLYHTVLKSSFTPEFLNRIDDIVVFRSLEECDLERIVDLELSKIVSRIQHLGFNVRVTLSARRQLARLGFKSEYGARALKRTLIDHVEEPISDLIISGELHHGTTIIIEKHRAVAGLKFRVA
ncbi:MAG: ATP-dependent Clp protease ATP-binding subunit [Rikenellaceae bacterium]